MDVCERKCTRNYAHKHPSKSTNQETRRSMQQIKRGIYYEDNYLGVTLGALVFSQGTIMIDAPLRPEDSRSWRSALLNQRGGTSRLLVCLDAHLDRTLGARAMECTIIAHQKTAQVFRNRPTIFKARAPKAAPIGKPTTMPSELAGHPRYHLQPEYVAALGRPEILLEHHSGPTAGSI
jgi:hypothetical protein